MESDGAIEFVMLHAHDLAVIGFMFYWTAKVVRALAKRLKNKEAKNVFRKS